jgi:hypothetical protein
MFGTELMQDLSFGRPHAKGRQHPGPLLMGKDIDLLCKSNNPVLLLMAQNVMYGT